MKSIKEVMFEKTLYHLDEYRRLKKELGEFDRLTCIVFSKYNTLMELIYESGCVEEWDLFLKGVYIKRQAYEEMK